MTVQIAETEIAAREAERLELAAEAHRLAQEIQRRTAPLLAEIEIARARAEERRAALEKAEAELAEATAHKLRVIGPLAQRRDRAVNLMRALAPEAVRDFAVWCVEAQAHLLAQAPGWQGDPPSRDHPAAVAACQAAQAFAKRREALLVRLRGAVREAEQLALEALSDEEIGAALDALRAGLAEELRA